MKLIKKNTSSPFQLARSIVDQGDQGGAYESGGYNPDSYDRSSEIYAATIEGSANVISAGLSSLTKSDINRFNVKNNERRKNRVSNIDKKIEKETTRMTDQGKQEVGTKKSKKLEERKQRIQGRIDKTDEKIKQYESIYGKDTSNDFLNKQRDEF